MKGRLLNRSARTEVLEKSRKQETHAARSIRGGRKQPASGSGWADKSDVKGADDLVECKRTDKKSYSLKLEELVKNEVYAVKAGKRPVFHVEIQKRSYAVVPWDAYLDLVEGQS